MDILDFTDMFKNNNENKNEKNNILMKRKKRNIVKRKPLKDMKHSQLMNSPPLKTVHKKKIMKLNKNNDLNDEKNEKNKNMILILKQDKVQLNKEIKLLKLKFKKSYQLWKQEKHEFETTVRKLSGKDSSYINKYRKLEREYNSLQDLLNNTNSNNTNYNIINSKKRKRNKGQSITMTHLLSNEEEEENTKPQVQESLNELVINGLKNRYDIIELENNQLKMKLNKLKKKLNKEKENNNNYKDMIETYEQYQVKEVDLNIQFHTESNDFEEIHINNNNNNNININKRRKIEIPVSPTTSKLLKDIGINLNNEDILEI